MNRTPALIPSDLPVVILTRVFDAPRSLVWRAITDPTMVPMWWGPRDSTAKVHALDVSVGGEWRFDSISSDGQVFSFWGVTVWLQEGERIAQTFHFMDFPPNLDVLVLEDLADGKTRLTSTTHCMNTQARDGMVGSGMPGGANESYDRLQELMDRLKG
jgi:uncharacterized protein YndB with AHSA1/START domain